MLNKSKRGLLGRNPSNEYNEKDIRYIGKINFNGIDPPECGCK